MYAFYIVSSMSLYTFYIYYDIPRLEIHLFGGNIVFKK